MVCFNTPQHSVWRNWHTRSQDTAALGTRIQTKQLSNTRQTERWTYGAADIFIGRGFSGSARSQQLSTSAAETYGRNSSEKWKLHNNFPCVLNTQWNVGDWCRPQGEGAGAAHVTRICQAQQAYLFLFDVSCFTQTYVYTIRSPTRPPVTDSKNFNVEYANETFWQWKVK